MGFSHPAARCNNLISRTLLSLSHSLFLFICSARHHHRVFFHPHLALPPRPTPLSLSLYPSGHQPVFVETTALGRRFRQARSNIALLLLNAIASWFSAARLAHRSFPFFGRTIPLPTSLLQARSRPRVPPSPRRHCFLSFFFVSLLFLYLGAIVSAY